MALKLPIFMDNHSTTPVDPRVLEEMLPYFTTKFGNAASRSHSFGWAAEEAVEHARERIAQLIGAKDAKEIVFTSGATESDNLALKGVAEFYKDKGNHIITTVTEHKAILDTCKRLEKEGFEVTYLGVDKDGRVDPDDVEKAITDKTILVSVMLANNEIGTVQPLEEIGKITRERGVLLHSDAVQGVGKVEFDVQKMNVDLASITAHKMYGPKGVGALYVRRSKPRVRLVAQMDGGGHERGMRSGTLNVPGIVGLRQGVRDHAAARARPRRRASSRCASACARASCRPARRGVHQRLDRAPAAGQPQHHLQLRRGRGADDGHQGRGGELRLGVHVASLEPSYVLRALGRRRRAGALEHPLRPRPLQHRGGGRLRGRPRRRQGQASCARCRRSRRCTRKASTCKSVAVGRLTGRDPSQKRRDRHGIQRQSHRALREPAERRHARQERPERRAPAWSARPPAAT